MCGDWCYTVRRATPCGLRDGLAAQGRSDRVARFEFSGSLSDEIAGKTRVSCLLPTPPPAFCRRADRAKGKGGPEDDKETVRQVANRLFCSPAVRDRRRTGDSRRMGDFVGQFRARAGRRDARTPPLAGYSRAASVSEPAAGLAWKTASRSSSAPSRSSIGPSMS